MFHCPIDERLCKATLSQVARFVVRFCTGYLLYFRHHRDHIGRLVAGDYHLSAATGELPGALGANAWTWSLKW